jgi:hypothetical protein
VVEGLSDPKVSVSRPQFRETTLLPPAFKSHTTVKPPASTVTAFKFLISKAGLQSATLRALMTTTIVTPSLIPS